VYAFDSKLQLMPACDEQAAAVLCRRRWEAAQFLAALTPPERPKPTRLQ
jgi:hypothetical protein